MVLPFAPPNYCSGSQSWPLDAEALHRLGSLITLMFLFLCAPRTSAWQEGVLAWAGSSVHILLSHLCWQLLWAGDFPAVEAGTS